VNPLARKPDFEKIKNFPGNGELSAGDGLSACVVSLAKESGIAEYHLTNDEISGNQRLSNLQEVANAASLYAANEEGLLEFLEHIELDRSMEEASGPTDDTVTLITLHNPKGLEFRRVIITGVEQGIFPREEKSGDDLEEERRLFYVGATRAMDELYFTSCAQRRMYGRTSPMEPSLFLRELDRKGIKVIGSVPYSFKAAAGVSAGISAGSTAGTFNAHQGRSGSFNSQRNTKSSDGRWTLGDKVFHDDHGYGSVAQIRESEDGPIVKVIFETGYEKSFLSLHQSSRFTKIGND
jgi:DNA helicase-2/ATP-dependent DNA helicase PcrA